MKWVSRILKPLRLSLKPKLCNPHPNPPKPHRESSPPVPVPRLPPEIISLIITFIPSRHSSNYLSLTLTSKEFHILANQFLYRSPHLESAAAVKLLKSTLERNRDLAGMVKNLKIPGDHYQALPEKIVLGLLRTVTEVVEVSLRRGGISLARDWLAELCESFHPFFQLKSNLTILNTNKAQLQGLSLTYMSARGPLDPSSTPPPNSLRFLSIKETYIFQNTTLALASTSLTSLSIINTGETSMWAQGDLLIQFLVVVSPTLKTIRLILGSHWNRWWMGHYRGIDIRDGEKSRWEAAFSRFEQLERFECDWLGLYFPEDGNAPKVTIGGGVSRLLPYPNKITVLGFYIHYTVWEDEMFEWLEYLSSLPPHKSILATVKEIKISCKPLGKEGKFEELAERLRGVLKDHGDNRLEIVERDFVREIMDDPSWGLE